TRSLEDAAGKGEHLTAALTSAAKAAEDALEATKSLVAQHGKAAAFQEKTVGLQDAGATVGFFLIRQMAEFAERQ
ncbi:MAG: dihydroxyacetone kinase subunit L, partial [Alphaproteobacteria bacterium]|nr:dihydroxyacetone kinase subunit L [Alphaproteobacteria bacterium]